MWSAQMPIRYPLRNMCHMSIIFMKCSHSFAVREVWIYCFLTSSLSIILVSFCDMHASSTVTLPVKTSSNRFPTASRSVGVISPVSPERVVSASCTIRSGSTVELSSSISVMSWAGAMQGAFTLNSSETTMALRAESTWSSPLNARWTAFPVSIWVTALFA